MVNDCFKYDPEMKHETISGLLSVTKISKPCISQALVKIILICLRDHKDIVHVECLKWGQTRGSRSVSTVENTLKVTRTVII